MSETYTISDINADLRKLLSYTKLFDADDEGYWILKDTGERFELKLDSKDAGKNIVLIQDPIPRGDFYTFNPFSEGLGKPNPATTYYYKALRIATNQTILMVLFYALKTMLENKLSPSDADTLSMSTDVVVLGSIPVGRKQTIFDIVDEEMLDEFKVICKRIDDTFVHVTYHTKDMSARVTCPILTDKEWDSKYTKDVRKKSVSVFKSLLLKVLNADSEEDIDALYTTKYKELGVKSAPRFHTTMVCYHKLYEAFNDISAEAYESEGTPSDAFVLDLGDFNELLERFPFAYQIAKHMVQPVVSSVKATSTATSDTSALRYTNMGAGNIRPDGRTSRFHNPPIDEFNRPTQINSTQPTFAPNLDTGGSRFRPHVIDEGPRDPFSPSSVVQSNGSQTPVGGFGFSSPNFGAPSFGFNSTPSFGGGFGFGNQSSFNTMAPSNFGQPGTRSWFG